MDNKLMWQTTLHSDTDSRRSALPLKIWRARHERDALIQDPVADVQIFIDRTTELFILDIVWFESTVSTVITVEWLKTRRPFNSREDGGDENGINAEVDHSAEYLYKMSYNMRRKHTIFTVLKIRNTRMLGGWTSGCGVDLRLCGVDAGGFRYT